MPIVIALIFAFAGVGLEADEAPGPRVLAQSADGKFRIERLAPKYSPTLIDVASERLVQVFPRAMSSFAFSPDGKVVAAILNARSTNGASIFFYGVGSGLIRTVGFGHNNLPIISALKRSLSLRLDWSSDGKFISVDIERGRSLGVVLDAMTGKRLLLVGRFAEQQNDAQVDRALADAMIGSPISSMKWNPKLPSIIAVGFHDGSVFLVDIDRILTKPKHAKVEIGRKIEKFKSEELTKYVRYHPQQKPLGWSPDGRYLVTVRTSEVESDIPDSQKLFSVVSIFDLAKNTVVRKVEVAQSRTDFDPLIHNALELHWEPSGRLTLKSREGTEALVLDYEMSDPLNYRGVCSTVFSGQSIFQRLFGRFF